MEESKATEEILISHLNERLKRSNAHYDYVKVLLLFWDGTSHQTDAFRNESRALGSFLAGTFKYDVEEHPIPHHLPQLSVQSRVTEEVRLASNAACPPDGRSLLIIHYGGHGDRDGDPEGRALWAAHASPTENEPMVYWGQIQDTLEFSTADILIVLDCCFSAQAGRASRKNSSRIELLTAASKKELTPLPGPGSFTTAFIKALQMALDEEGHAKISTVHARLSKRESKLFATSVNISIRGGFPDRSIKLSPLGNERIVHLEPSSRASSIRLLIHTDKLDNDRIDELVSWLRSDIPPNLCIQVEGIVRKTLSLQSLVSNEKTLMGPLMRGLNREAFETVVTSSMGISDQLERYGTQRIQNTNQTAGLQRNFFQKQSTNFLRQLESFNSKVVEVVEKGILYSPLASDPKKMEEVIQDPKAVELGIVDQLHLRQRITSSDGNAAISELQAGRNESSSQYWRWKESKTYGQYLNPARIPEVETRVALLAELLNASKNPDFRALRCARWFHVPEDYQFVLEFDVPTSVSSEPKISGRYNSSLKSIIMNVVGAQRPSLGQRFRLGFMIANAVRHWHSVGWVHQNITSHNVMFFSCNKEFDYGEPFLQGFDFARPDLGPSIGSYVDHVADNVYRHPDRQGPARQGHQKIHDMYSLGVVLLEIGLWEDACITAGWKKGKDLAVMSMDQNLKAAALKRLHHYAGRDYQEAVMTCLKSSFKVDMDDALGSHLAKAFEAKVLDKLRQGLVIH